MQESSKLQIAKKFQYKSLSLTTHYNSLNAMNKRVIHYYISHFRELVSGTPTSVEETVTLTLRDSSGDTIQSTALLGDVVRLHVQLAKPTRFGKRIFLIKSCTLLFQSYSFSFHSRNPNKRVFGPIYHLII